MQELRLVAVSEDGSYLVLATAGRGTRFTLPVDDRLRAAVRGHFSRLGQFEIEVESPLRPKEIQARIRAGETAEEIAESAGIPVERVRWFEGPVLQEREYMAQQAQRVIARRPGDASPGPPLGEMVEERLSRRGVDLEEVEWDSWKCEDSTWRVRLSFFDDGRPHAAEWVFDPRRRQVSPLDEEAARLSSLVLEEPAAPTVTPLVPRRPAMKIVSDSRADVAAEQRREYGAERGRSAEPRRQSVAPHRREFVAPREPEIVPAARERHTPDPAAQEVDAVAQATGVYTRETEQQSRPEQRAETARSSVTEAGRDTPAGEAAEDPRQVVAEVVTEVVTAVVPEPESADESPRSAASAPPEPAERPRTASAAESGEQAAASEPVPTGSEIQDPAGRESAGEPARQTAAAEPAAEQPRPQAAKPAPAAPAAPAAESGSADPVTAVAGRADAPAEAAEASAEQASAEQAKAAQAGAARAEAAKAEAAKAEAERAEAEQAEAAKAEAERAEAERAEAEQAEAERTAAEQAAAERAAAEQAEAERTAAEQAEADKAAAEKAKEAKTEKVTPAPKRKVPVPAPTSPVEPPARPGRRKNSARGKRASVPSWDEIMFGARRPE